MQEILFNSYSDNNEYYSNNNYNNENHDEIYDISENITMF